MNSANSGSIENAITGRYSFNITDIFKEAWEKTHGIKATFWKAFLLLVIIATFAIFFAALLGNLVEGAPANVNSFQPIHDILQIIIEVFITIPLTAGLWVMMIRYVSGMPVTYKLIFNYFSYWKTLWAYPVILGILQLLHVLAIYSTLILIIIPIASLFFIVTYYMFIPLAAEKTLSTGAALETSRKTIFHHWFKMLWFLILIGLIAFASLLTLGIAYIWTLPWINNASAILYRNMFGVSNLQTK